MITNKLNIMRYLSVTSVLLLLVMSVTGCNEEAAPTENSSIENPTGVLSKNPVIHRVSVGGADICEALGLPTGCDANFSLVAIQKADGTVSGQWQDTFSQGNGGVHVAIDCLFVDGNEAWVSGVITNQPFAGTRVMARVVDNGTSANDPADQISFTTASELGCDTAPDLGLMDLTHGQVKVR